MSSIRARAPGGGFFARWLDPYRSALAARDLRLLLGGLLVSATGSWAYNVALFAFVFGRTHSLGWVGASGLVRFVPSLVLSPYAGVIAERSERIRLLVSSDLLSALFQGGLVAVAATGAPVALALVLVGLTAASNVVYQPTVAATIPSVVRENDLVAANALNGTIDNLVVILGPAIGAALLLIASPRWVFAVNAASFLLASLLVWQIRTRSQPVDVTEEGSAGTLRQVMVGMRTIVGAPGGAHTGRLQRARELRVWHRHRAVRGRFRPPPGHRPSRFWLSDGGTRHRRHPDRRGRRSAGALAPARSDHHLAAPPATACRPRS